MLITTAVRLRTVHADWANGMVPQELHRHGLQWQFNNGDAVYSVGGGEANAGPRPVRAGSLNDTAYAWPDAEGDFSGATGAVVNLAGRIRVAYKPLTVHLLISGPKAFATARTWAAWSKLTQEGLYEAPTRTAPCPTTS